LCLESHLAGAKAEIALGAIIDGRDFAPAQHPAAPFAQDPSEKVPIHAGTKASSPDSLYPARDGQFSEEKAGGRQGG
jgi:hypothetical protein